MSCIAIIIPYFKLKFFRENLESLAAQTDQRFTVYIGNDASPENPEDLLKEFEGKFNFVYKKFEQNLGGSSLTKQWDRCIEMLNDEEWFMILGDDDYLSENVVEEFYDNLFLVDEQEANIIRFSQCNVNKDGIKLNNFTKGKKVGKSFDLWKLKADQRTRLSLSELIFKKEKYDLVKFREYPLAWNVDNMAVLEIGAFANIVFIQKAQVYVRISEISISGSTKYCVEKNLAQYFNFKDVFFSYNQQISKRDLLFIALLYYKYSLVAKQDFSTKSVAKIFLKRRSLGGFIRLIFHMYLKQKK